VIDCEHTARALTLGVYTDRVLGKTEARDASTATVISWCGNNVRCRGDLNSRVLKVPFHSTRVDPENRPFAHIDPIAWTFTNRSRILQALYTILLGNPRLTGKDTTLPVTRFKLWWSMVGAAVEHAARCHVARLTHWSSSCPPTSISFADEFRSNEDDNEQTDALTTVVTLLAERTWNAKRIDKWPPTMRSFTASEVVDRTCINADFSNEFYAALDAAANSGTAPALHAAPADVPPEAVGGDTSSDQGRGGGTDSPASRSAGCDRRAAFRSASRGWLVGGKERHAVSRANGMMGAFTRCAARASEIAMITKAVAMVVFSGEFGDPEHTNNMEWSDIVLDPDLAADALRRAGYTVTRLPDRYGGYLWHPLDDFMEAVIVAPHELEAYGAIMDKIDAIVGRYGGQCQQCGPLEPDHEPFADLFSGHAGYRFNLN